MPHKPEDHAQVVTGAARPRTSELAFELVCLELRMKSVLRQQGQRRLQFRGRLRMLAGQTADRSGETPQMAGAVASSEEAFDDLGGRGGATTAGLEFTPGGFHSLDDLCAAIFREPALKNFDKRFLFSDGEFIGGIQNLRKLCHAQNLALCRTLGSSAFVLELLGPTVHCRVRPFTCKYVKARGLPLPCPQVIFPLPPPAPAGLSWSARNRR